MPPAPVKELESEVTRLRSLVRQRDQQLAEKNRELDALHYVWCSGGCEDGIHRHTDEELTPDIVGRAIRNTTRLVNWYTARSGRDYYGIGGFSLAGGHTWEKLEAVWKQATKEIMDAADLPDPENS
jgi:hypothetical protein